MGGEPGRGVHPFLAQRVAHSAAYRAHLELALKLGISEKRLNGWEPAQATDYEYDGDGRLLRAVTRREPEWDDEQRASMLALHAYQSSLCGGCGGWLPDTTGDETDVSYVATDPVRCLRCTAISIQAKEYAEQDHPQALLYPTERRAKGG
jgi:hypothetical protein